MARSSSCRSTVLAAACSAAMALVTGTAVGCTANVSLPQPRVPQVQALLPPEIDGLRYRDAYEMIERLRPGFLRGDRDPRGSTLVVVDNLVLGPVETLRGFPLAAVVRISRLSASECEMRFGSGRPMPTGAIWIETR